MTVEGQEYDLLNQVSDDNPASNPEQQALCRELSGQISHALQSLTPRERLVFELKHFEGLKLRTVGEILHTSEGAVKRSLCRATHKLRYQLARYKNGEILDQAVAKSDVTWQITTARPDAGVCST